jgi:hypothetical protein
VDREVRPGCEVLSFDGPEPTVRLMLDRLVWTKEVWVAAMVGADLPSEPDRSMPALKERFAAAATIDGWQVDDLEVREHGDVAVCAYRWSEHGSHHGQPFA